MNEKTEKKTDIQTETKIKTATEKELAKGDGDRDGKHGQKNEENDRSQPGRRLLHKLYVLTKGNRVTRGMEDEKALKHEQTQMYNVGSGNGNHCFSFC